MNVLGIESSCDETAAAVVQDGTKTLAEVTATSAGLHARTGGVIPEDAARKQIQSIIPVIDLTLKDASMTKDSIEAIAVTYGPGLIGSLLVGVEAAKTLASLWNKPIIPVNHLVAHIYANWITEGSLPEFPALALVVSGGHTDLVLMKDHGDLKWIGGTRDDAAGEAFDKTARLLGLPYPGGPRVAQEADAFRKDNPNVLLDMFPRPMIDEPNYEWSFSGLKTAVLKKIEDIYSREKPIKDVKLSDYKKISASNEVKKNVPRIAAEVQEAIVDSLVKKSIRAVEEFKPKSFLLAGGVAANIRLRDKLDESISQVKNGPAFHVPLVGLCTDNASYIASFAYYNNNPLPWQQIDANPQLTITGEE